MEGKKNIESEQLVYIDERGIVLTICKERSWGKMVKNFWVKIVLNITGAPILLLGMLIHQSIAPMVFNSSCNKGLFASWVEQFLLKELKPQQVVVMYNASFYKSHKTRESIEYAPCKIIFC